ncbi:MAG TPA: NUDIX hydrolase [Leptolyngbya sp.]|jgi:ADP-ribose pyrophosphatase YjhB (NUDIX family)|nr:NUDIX hydrolase [Leptolyngbya sp.]
MPRFWRYFQTVLGVIFRHPVTGTSIITVLPDDRIVLIRRRDNGLWGLPGGIVDWGENLPTAIRRELAEETGLELTKIRRLVGVYSAPDRDPRMHSICVVVEVEAIGAFNPTDIDEVSDVQAFRRSEVSLDRLAHDHGKQLRDYFEGKTTIA